MTRPILRRPLPARHLSTSVRSSSGRAGCRRFESELIPQIVQRGSSITACTRPLIREGLAAVLSGSGSLVRRPAAVFLMAPGPQRACVVQQALADNAPDCVRTVQYDGVSLLNHDTPRTATATHPEDMPTNLAQSQRLLSSGRLDLCTRLVQD